jgi:hypothetical protein
MAPVTLRMLSEGGIIDISRIIGDGNSLFKSYREVILIILQ